MSTLSEAELAVESGYYSMPDVYAAELGPYAFAYRFRIRGYTHHSKGGDPAKAWMKLFYDGAEVGSASDQGFDTSDLAVNYDLYLAAGSTAQLRIETGNEKATVTGYGFDFRWSQA